ncbi:MAG: hypothetical protein V1818_01065 [Candidatus Aenigmatarchaeota archaeon]
MLSICKDSLEKYRNSEALLSYKKAELSGEVQSFPCVGCHAKYKDASEEMVEIGVDNLSLEQGGKKFLLEGGWEIKKQGVPETLFEKKHRLLNSEEWCSLYCKKGMRIALMSDKQLLCYEQIRPVGSKIKDIKKFTETDNAFFDSFYHLSFPETHLLVINRKRM